VGTAVDAIIQGDAGKGVEPTSTFRLALAFLKQRGTISLADVFADGLQGRDVAAINRVIPPCTGAKTLVGRSTTDRLRSERFAADLQRARALGGPQELGFCLWMELDTRHSSVDSALSNTSFAATPCSQPASSSSSLRSADVAH